MAATDRLQTRTAKSTSAKGATRGEAKATLGLQSTTGKWVAKAPLTRATYAVLTHNVDRLAAVAVAYADAQLRQQKTGRGQAFVVEVGDGGDLVIKPQVEPVDTDPALETALAAARGRGRQLAADLLAGDDMLSADALGSRLGVSRMTINERRKRHELLALDGAKRGFRFPDWQVDDQGKPLAVLPRLFAVLGGDPWTVYRFLVQRHSVLGGRTARAALAEGEGEAVVAAAEALAQGAFA